MESRAHSHLESHVRDCSDSDRFSYLALPLKRRISTKSINQLPSVSAAKKINCIPRGKLFVQADICVKSNTFCCTVFRFRNLPSKPASKSGLLNWVLIDRRSIQLFSSLNWTELNEIKIWTLNAERQNPKNKLSSSPILLNKKMTQNGKKIWNFLFKNFFLASPFLLLVRFCQLPSQQPSLFLVLFLY